jgi:tetratricopeptide (TPR) repeat protein
MINGNGFVQRSYRLSKKRVATCKIFGLEICFLAPIIMQLCLPGVVKAVDISEGDQAYRSGDYAKAEDFFLRMVGSLKPDEEGSIGAIFAFNYLANIYGDQKNYAKKESILKRSIAAQKDQKNWNKGLTYSGLAGCYLKQRKFSEAEQAYKQALSTSEQHCGKNGMDNVLILLNMGAFYCTTERFDDAKKCYDKALLIQQELNAPEYSIFGDVKDAYAYLLLRLGRFGEAEKALLERVDVNRKEYGEDSQQVVALVEYLSEVEGGLGKFGEAEAYARFALAKFLKINYLQGVAVNKVRVARCCTEQGKLEEAQSILENVIATCQKNGETDTDMLATALSAQANVFLKKGKIDQGMTQINNAIAIHEKLFGDRNTIIAKDLSIKAQLLDKSGRKAEALALITKALQIDENILGKKHPKVAVLQKVREQIGK